MTNIQNRLRLFPKTTTVDKDDYLCIQQQRLADLAVQYGTPLYLYDIPTIKQAIKSYRDGLAHYPGDSRLTYASKAYLCLALARLLAAEGMGVDVASAGELFLAYHGGIDPMDMHFHGNNKTPFDLNEALRVGVGRMVIDNHSEYELLSQMTIARQEEMRLWLRINPDIAANTQHPYTATGTANTKFGLLPQQAQQLAGQILNSANATVRLEGLHAHIGSNLRDSNAIKLMINCLLDLAALLKQRYSWHMAELSPGGGWGVPYHPNDPALPIVPFVTQLATWIAEGCQKRRLKLPTLILEPGRSVVAQAGVAIYTVGNKKQLGRTFVSINGGLVDNPRPALYQAQYTALLANRATAPCTERVTVVGSTCESGDYLIDEIELPPVEPGDFLAVPVSGAYQLMMSSNYNATLRPAVLFMEEGQAIGGQRRETFADLIHRDMKHPLIL